MLLLCPMNFLVAFLCGSILFSFTTFAAESKCPAGQYRVKEHHRNGYTKSDGDFSPEEDYANNLEHFLYSPDRLKKVTPEAYLWLKKRFGEGFKLKERKK